MLEGSRPVLLAMIAPLGLLGCLPLAGKKRKRLRLYLGIVALALVAAGADIYRMRPARRPQFAACQPAGNRGERDGKWRHRALAQFDNQHHELRA